MEKIKITFTFEPGKDKPGYYWFNKRRCEIILEEILKKAIDEYKVSSERAALQEFFNCEELEYPIC